MLNSYFNTSREFRFVIEEGFQELTRLRASKVCSNDGFYALSSLFRSTMDVPWF